MVKNGKKNKLKNENYQHKTAPKSFHFSSAALKPVLAPKLALSHQTLRTPCARG